ncbi:MAG: hypothetical protein P9L88_08630 [Candidatus Tantalella remota]|nr:hypothetical protein [Candidatus Tantalella remota]
MSRQTAFFAVLCVVTALAVSSCTPSFPREKLPEAVKKVCKDEYNMDVEVTVAGSTMGIYYPMKGLLDMGLGISEEAWDEISNLILVASRVVLSTDADIKFYCVVTQDARLPELQVVIIKHVGDVKRSMYRNISRSESFKRTLFSINLTPQAKKERSIEKVFNKIGVGEDTRKKVLDEFFRSPPTKLSDIGYWRGNFYLKDITMPEFLASQMANRIKIDFRGEEKLKKSFDFKSAEGSFVKNAKGDSFLLKFKIEDKQQEGEPVDLNARKIREILGIANKVVEGYKFMDFEYLTLEDQLANARIVVTRENLSDPKRKKLSIEEMVQAPAGYFVSASAQ